MGIMGHIGTTIGQYLLKVGQEGLEKLRKEALEKGLDFHNLVAATALEKGIDAVTTIERNEAKTLLFGFNYGRRGGPRS